MKKLLANIIVICLGVTMVFSSLISAETTNDSKYLVGLGDSWCQGVGLGSGEMESKNAVTLTANALGWTYKNFGQGGKYANDVLNQMKNTDSDQYKEMLKADTVFIHGGINDISSNYRPSMVGNSYMDYSDLSNITKKYNLGYIPKNYDAEARTIGGRTPEKYFDDTLRNVANNTVKILSDATDIIRKANPDALVVVSTMYCNYTGGIAEFPEGFTFDGLTDDEKLSAADEMADYYFRKYFEIANEGVKAFAAKYDNVVVLDDSSIIPQQVRSGDVNDYMNGGHPKAAGYKLLSDEMVKLIQNYYGSEVVTTADTTANTTAEPATTAATTTKSSSDAKVTTKVDKMVAFGDSVIAGLCMGGPNKNTDAYGDQKATDLLGKEFGLKRYTDANKAKNDKAEKWFFNSSVSGYTTGQIYEKEVLSFDKELLAQADLVYMNGGTNDACATMSKFLGSCSWGASCADWTLDQTKKYIQDNSEQMSKIANMVKDNFVKIIKYLASLDGFDGKIIIEDYPNQYAGNENTNAEYFWDEFYERAVTSGQRAAIEETKDVYSNVELLDITSKLRDGAKYTNITNGDAQHLTFEGNRAVYRELSLMLNSDGANLLTFESTDIPENAVWRTAYDFENYNVGDTNITGIQKGYDKNNVVVADMSETSDGDGNLKTGANTNSKKILKFTEKADNRTYQAKVDLSSFSKNAYGFRLKFTYPTEDSNQMKYIELHTTTGKNFIKVLPTSNTSWVETEICAGYSMYTGSPWYSTILNISDIQNVDYFKIWGNTGNSYYLDDIEVLSTDSSTPVATTSPTAPSVTGTTSPRTTTTAAPLPDGYYDAYTATLGGGARKATNHTGYTGQGFVDNFGAVGSSITFNVDVKEAGNYTFNFRYANACGNGKDSYPALYVDGVKVQELNFKENGKSGLPNFTGWDVWSENTEYSADLTAGAHTIKLAYDRATNSTNVDGLTLIKNETPDTTTTTTAETTTTTVADTTTEPTTAGVTTTTVATTTTTAAETTTTTVPVKPVIYGDADGNGKVETADVLVMNQYLANINVNCDVKAADLNGNGEVDTVDVLMLNQMLAGITVEIAK